MVTIVSHLWPDLDSICSIWILKRFGGYADAELAFIPTGTTLNGRPADSDPEIIHVDTGRGRFDHHQEDVHSHHICSAKLVWKAVRPTDTAMGRVVDYVTQQDNGLIEPWLEGDRWGWGGLMRGLNLHDPDDPRKVVEAMLPIMDAWYAWAQELEEVDRQFANRIEFETPWGKGAAFEGDLGGIRGYSFRHGAVVFVRRTTQGWIGIEGRVRHNVDLTPVYQRLRGLEPEADWFLHASKRLVLCGSWKSPAVHPSRLSLMETVEILKNAGPLGQ
ncbi:MAG TPA: hypothetical protein VJO15_08360 [Dehalococcoidia bacterium]|nr:hypothetical protein [Dehalococcoidia bacterium]